MLEKNFFKYVEIIVLGFIFPIIIVGLKLSNFILLFLWTICFYCLVIYSLKHKFNFNNSIYFTIKQHKKYIFFIILRWILASIFLFFFTKHLFPEKLFLIQKNSDNLIYKIFIFYPILSALPQEFIFCTFFFSRYKNLFKSKKSMIFMSSIIFCFAHIFVINWIAPLLGYIGGLIFAQTYMRTKSLFLVTVEHSLYGNTLFFLGLGWFFWGGSVGN